MIRQFFDLLDKDHDQSIDRSEWNTVFTEEGLWVYSCCCPVAPPLTVSAGRHLQGTKVLQCCAGVAGGAHIRQVESARLGAHLRWSSDRPFQSCRQGREAQRRGAVLQPHTRVAVRRGVWIRLKRI